MAGVQNWSAKVIQLLPFKGALSVWFTCAHKHSHIHTHTFWPHVFFIFIWWGNEKNVQLQNGGWRVMVFGQEWQLWNEGISQSATLHTHTQTHTHGLGWEVRWRRVVRVEGGDWRIEEGGGGGEVGCKGHKVTMWGSVFCVSPCVFAVGRRELDMLKLQAVFALFFFSLLFVRCEHWELTSSYMCSNLSTCAATHVHTPGDTPWTQRSQSMCALGHSFCLLSVMHQPGLYQHLSCFLTRAHKIPYLF